MRVAGGEDECQLRDCLRSAIGPARFHFRIIMDESVGSIPIEGPGLTSMRVCRCEPTARG